MFKRILVAVDDSDPANRAVDAAEDLARRYGAHLRVVNVHQPIALTIAAAGSMPLPGFVDDTDREVEALDRSQVAAIVDRLKAAGIDAEGTLVVEGGPVGQAIADVASQTAADLVVTGSRGRSQLGGLVLGSTAYQLIHLVQCPVLVVR
ncbi:MAG TPA: universal stress protein [Candidatus Micrarchaeia archaeon]|nr:universal stress protein [Candidatus Micrarchaeia archaeon]